MDGTHIATVTLGDRIRALLQEAWGHRRRRRLRSLSVVLALAAVAAGIAVAQRHDAPSPVPRQSPAPVAAAVLSLPRAPGIGVACPGAPNSIACDRIGIAVWLRSEPIQLVVTIGGRSVALHNQHIALCAPRRPCGTYFTGYLQPAGLLDGALKVQPDRGRSYWAGGHPVTGTLRLRATYRDGRTAQTTRRVPLSPGWG